MPKGLVFDEAPKGLIFDTPAKGLVFDEEPKGLVFDEAPDKPSFADKAGDVFGAITKPISTVRNRIFYSDVINSPPSITQETTRPQSWVQQNFGEVGTVKPTEQKPLEPMVSSEVRPGESFQDIGAEVEKGPYGRFIKSFSGGALGSVKGLTDFAKAAGLRDTVMGPLLEQGMKDLQVENPNLFDKVVGGFGSSATFFIPGLGASKLSTALALGPKAARWLGMGTSGVLEAMVNAGSDYDSMLKKGESVSDARIAAAKTFVANVPLNIALDKWMFSEKEGEAVWKSILKGGGQETIQEGTQQVISNINTGEPISAGVGESALIGGLVGGVSAGGLGYVQNQPIRDVRDRLKAYNAQQEPMAPDVIQPEAPLVPQVAPVPEVAKPIEPIITKEGYHRDTLKGLRDEISMTGPKTEGGVVKDKDGNVSGQFGAISDLPVYAQGTGYSATDLIPIIDKYLSGGKLTDKQSMAIEKIYKQSPDYVLRMKDIEDNIIYDPNITTETRQALIDSFSEDGVIARKDVEAKIDYLLSKEIPEAQPELTLDQAGGPEYEQQLAAQAQREELRRQQEESQGPIEGTPLERNAKLPGDFNVGQQDLFNMGGSSFADTGGYANLERYTPAPEAGPYQYVPKIQRFFLRAPEMLQLFKDLTGGHQPSVVKKFRDAFQLGQANLTDKKGNILNDIELRYDLAKGKKIATLVSKGMEEAREAAKTWLDENGIPYDKRLVEVEFNKKIGKFVASVYDGDTEFWLKTMAHEIGHIVDYIKVKDFEKGNIFAHIASLKGYMLHLLEAHPGSPHKVITDKEKAKIRRRAKRILDENAGKDIDVTELVNVYEGITPQDIINIWNSTTASVDKSLFDYISRLTGKEKAAIIKSALQGIVPEELAKLGGKVVGQKEVTTTKRVGKEVTKEMVKEKYRQLIEEEIIKRGLYEYQNIMGELKKLTQLWKPFNEARAKESYIKYRYSPEELYADAFSVLLNDPEMLKQEAPNFYRAFEAYLDARPEARDAYNAINKLASESESMAAKRSLDELKNMLGRGEARRQELGKKKEDTVSLWTKFERTFITKYADWSAVARKLKKEGRSDQHVTELLNELSYSSSLAYSYLDRIAPFIKGVEKEVSLYMFTKRASTERYFNFNPIVGSGKVATIAHEVLKQELQAEGKLEQVEAAVAKIYEIRQQLVFPKLEAANVFSPELMENIKDNVNYAKFQVIQYIDNAFGAGDNTMLLHRQLGTLKDIDDPLRNTLMQDVALMRMADIVMTKRAAVRVLEENLDILPDAVFPADSVGNEFLAPNRVKHRDRYPKDFDANQYSLFQFMQGGKFQGYYIDKNIAKMFTNDTKSTNIILSGFDATGRFVRELIIQKNVGFMIGNVMRDMPSVWINMPGINPLNTFHAMLDAIPEAAQYAFLNKMSEDIQFMLENKMLITARDYGALYSETDPEATQLTKILESYNIQSTGEKLHSIGELFRLLNVNIDNLGNFFEKLSKITAFKQGKAMGMDINSKEFAETIRAEVGSPDFLKGGIWKQFITRILLFANPNIQGQVSQGPFWGSAYKKANKREWWTKFVVAAAVPMLLQIAAEMGLIGADWDGDGENDLQTEMKGIGSFWKANFTVIPLYYNHDTNKTLFIPISVAWSHIMLRNMMWLSYQGLSGQNLGKGWPQLFLDQTPLQQVHPLLTVAFNWGSYLGNRNPYDLFRAREIVPQRVWDTQNPVEILPYMFEDTWNRMGFRTLMNYPFSPKENKEEGIYKTPVLGNILKRFARWDDSGHFERTTSELQKDRASRAGRSLDVDRIIQATLKDNLRENYASLQQYQSHVSAISARLDTYLRQKGLVDKTTSKKVLSNDIADLAYQMANAKKSNVIRLLNLAKSERERKIIMNTLPQLRGVLKSVNDEKRKLKRQRPSKE